MLAAVTIVLAILLDCDAASYKQLLLWDSMSVFNFVCVCPQDSSCSQDIYR